MVLYGLIGLAVAVFIGYGVYCVHFRKNFHGGWNQPDGMDR